MSAIRYREIHDTLHQKIVSGDWPPGFKLPSEPELARIFGCARMTVGKALGALAERGLITRRRRAGTVVNALRPPESVLEIHDIEADVQALGHEYRYERLGRAPRRASATDAALLDVPAGTLVLALRCLHRVHGLPYVLEERLINLQSVPAAKQEDFESASPGRWLLSKVPWTDAEHRISCMNADGDIARLLEIPQRHACLCVERRTWLGEQRITHVLLIYPGDQHRIFARFRKTGAEHS